MIAVDTSVLVYAHRQEFEQHEPALAALRELAEGTRVWGLPVFVIGEFVRVVTHPQILDPPSSLDDALAALDAVLASPSLRVLAPGERYWEILRDVSDAARVTGNLAVDAEIAAACLEHGVGRVLTEDLDFRRFPGVTVERVAEG